MYILYIQYCVYPFAIAIRGDALIAIDCYWTDLGFYVFCCCALLMVLAFCALVAVLACLLCFAILGLSKDSNQFSNNL